MKYVLNRLDQNINEVIKTYGGTPLHYRFILTDVINGEEDEWAKIK